LFTAVGNFTAMGNFSDGVISSNYSDDVISIDTAWDKYFPPEEETSDPVLSEIYDNSTIGLDLTNTTAFWSDNSTIGSGLTNTTGFRTLNGTHPKMSLMAAEDFYLWIMPLGASITEGVRSTDGNGYRKYLRDQLRWKGWRVNMVGSKQNGNMADKDNEGMTCDRKTMNMYIDYLP
jgi:hypothetical protein